MKLQSFHTKKVELNVSRCLLPSILSYTCLLYHLIPLMEKLQNLLLLLQLLLLLPLSLAYAPPDKYLINCGSNSNVSSSGQNFVGDLNSGVSFFVGQSSPVPHANPSSSQLYQSARIYRRPSFYEFVIKENSTYFVRLHFFVSSSDSNVATAKFNVSALGFWLLSNFTLRNRSNLAFVNAIEVFLASEDFIPDTASLLTPAGSRISFDGLSSQVLRTLFRINVGGPTLTLINDTLWRNWIPDDSFLLDPMTARNSDFFSDSPNYREGGATEFTAPNPVYSTAKEMNIDESSQLNFFNVTWSFNVSKSSSHFVRVHFCDIISVSLNVIIFDIYIYNKFSARINPYDMGLLAVPFYYDFVVDSDESGIMNISIVPRLDSPNQIAFLNGLEIMELIKKSDFVSWPKKPESNRTSLFAIVGSIGGGSFVIILVAIALLSLKRRKAKVGQSSSWPLSGPFYAKSSSHNRMSEKTSNMLPSNLNLSLRLSYHEMEQSTKNFDSNLVIGEGGFEKVYQGIFRDMKVVVKRSEPGHGQCLLEFQTEIVVLSQIRHCHLVSLIGYCDEIFEMILVYEYIKQGTLRDHLYYSTTNHDKSYSARSELSWKQRLEICVGAAKGLNYLHTGAAGGIIHRDVTSTNILLDEQFVAKVTDFGLSKLGIPDVEHSVDVKCTFELTDKSNVYFFRVVLLEVICFRPAGMHWLRKGQLDNIIDPMLVDTINPNSFRKFAETTENCLKVHGSERPTMHDVLWDLEYALQFLLTPINRGPLEDTVDGDNTTLVFDDTSDVTASEVFTELRIGGSR
ncbi:hypothetical protein ES332_D11G227000v1 [Gossypium tomentosum]|uniref:Protein kinase domain-containing protein n=1 Tax=Gossypium tomentosum TaxID=34277 RepID=A0A5D2ISS6_GOSTO|nr:hypothetical protein ES332_D11G227000v1 [Gossypium tomentosum]